MLAKPVNPATFAPAMPERGPATRKLVWQNLYIIKPFIIHGKHR